MIFFINTIKNLSLYIFLTISISSAQKQYSDLNAMLNEVEPFQDQINEGFLNVIKDNSKVTSIFWFDQDSTRFTKLFHYDINDDLYLITELRDDLIVKEVNFHETKISDRFIKYLYGANFEANEDYVTEIIYNNANLPISYYIESSRKDYIGHITLNYDDKNHIIREAWFKGSKKIRQFLK